VASRFVLWTFSASPNLIKCHDAGEAKIEKPSISFLYLLMDWTVGSSRCG